MIRSHIRPVNLYVLDSVLRKPREKNRDIQFTKLLHSRANKIKLKEKYTCFKIGMNLKCGEILTCNCSL